MARATLVEQLGIEPSAELVDLEARILRQDPELLGPTAPPSPATECPYKGLAPYDVGDGDSFFGRSADVDELLGRMRSARLIVVTGPSGSGKSSLVRAGLVPALVARGRQRVACMRGPNTATVPARVPEALVRALQPYASSR